MNSNGVWKIQLARYIKTYKQRSGAQRFGQTLYNAIVAHDAKEHFVSDDYKSRFHERLFYLDDKELASIMLEYINSFDQMLEELKKT